MADIPDIRTMFVVGSRCRRWSSARPSMRIGGSMIPFCAELQPAKAPYSAASEFLRSGGFLLTLVICCEAKSVSTAGRHFKLL